MAILNFDLTSVSLGSWAQSEEIGRAATQAEVVSIAQQMANGLRDEFAAGGHNRTGETIDSVRVQLGPMSAEVTMAGGSTYVEYGFPGHYIEANQAQSLHWEADDKFSEGFARPGVWVSGYEGDPFVQRAMNDINFGQQLQLVAEKIFTSMVNNSGGKLRWMSQQDSGMTTSETTIVDQQETALNNSPEFQTIMQTVSQEQ